MANKGEGEQNQAGRHQEVGHKSLLQSDALYQVPKRTSFFFFCFLGLNLFEMGFLNLVFLFIKNCSIFWRLVFTQESQKP